MSVYVDDIRDWTLIAKARGLRHTHWCHLTADTEQELHAFADRLGLRRSWYQRKSPADYRWHYDITPPKRTRAITLGAVEVDRRYMGLLMIGRRDGWHYGPDGEPVPGYVEGDPFQPPLAETGDHMDAWGDPHPYSLADCVSCRTAAGLGGAR